MKTLTTLLLLLSLTLNTQAQQNQDVQEPKLSIPRLNPQKARQDLNKAYQKEYAFLTTQIKSIKARTQAYKRTAAEDKTKLNQQISTLENQLLSLEQSVNQKEDDVFALERNTESASDNSSLLKATITQAKSTLSEFNQQLATDDETNTENSDIEQVAKLINFANQVIQKHSTISKTQGSFFLQNGQEVHGDILKIGNIASYGFSKQGAGALAPAGENTFKVWRDEDSPVIAELFNGKAQASLPIFLYESSIKSIDEKKDKTIRSVIDSGGLIAWIIVFLGVFAFVLILLRIWFLKKSSSSTEKILNKVVKNIEDDDMEHALRVASHKHSSSGRVMYAVLRNIERDREHIEDIVSEAILHESGQLNRFGSLIMVVATVSPLLGLLGTVTGMISTFDIITEFGTGDPKLLSEGISVALVTTEVGLAVAIPALLFGNILSGWAERIKDDMEKAALRVINVFKKLQN